MRYVRAVCLGFAVGLLTESLWRSCVAASLLLFAFWLTDDIHERTCAR